MNLKRITSVLLKALAFAILVHSCSKDDDGIRYSKPDPQIVQILEQISADSISHTIAWLEGMTTRFTLADNHRNITVAIMNKFKSYGYDNAQLDSFPLNIYFRGTYYETWQYNVVAKLTGIVSPDSLTIVGAHHDCILMSNQPVSPFDIAPGADDNASGVAVTLEIARVLKKSNFNPRTTIVFATFAAEELGLYGSTYMANRLSDTLARVKFMLNNDMVSFCPVMDSAAWYLNIIDYPNSTELRLNAQTICSLYTLLKMVNDNTYQNYSDSYPFYQQGFKPLFFITQSDDPNYHTLNDKAFYQNPRFAREVAKLNCAYIIEGNR